MNKWLKAFLIVIVLLLCVLCCCVVAALSTSLAAVNAAAHYTPAPTSTPSPATYEYTYRVKLINSGIVPVSTLTVNVAVPQDTAYQKVLSWDIRPDDYEEIDRQGNSFAKLTFNNIKIRGSVNIVVVGRVMVMPVSLDLGACSGQLPTNYTGPEKYIESSDPKIRDLAVNLSTGKETACEKVRAFYEYVADTMEYESTNYEKGAVKALRTKTGDCVEYSDLLIALTRAAGIPARKVYGVTYALDNQIQGNKDLGHQWAEIYFPGTGWAPVDPTWGKEKNNRDRYFAALTPTHIFLTKDIFSMEYTYWYDSGTGKVDLEEEWEMRIVK